jgi:cytoskeleton protein RodZ
MSSFAVAKVVLPPAFRVVSDGGSLFGKNPVFRDFLPQDVRDSPLDPMSKVTKINADGNDGPSRRRIHLREISGDSESPLDTVGQDLRAARLRRGDDLASVSKALKIRKDHLEAVEEDNFANLPGKTYAIGFVRSYAQYLGLDVAMMVDRYKEEISGRRDDHVPPASSFHAEESRRLPQGWRIVAGIVGLALIYGVWHLVSAGYAPQTVPPAPSLNPSKPQATAGAEPETPRPASEEAAPAAPSQSSAGPTATPPPAANAAPPPAPAAPPQQQAAAQAPDQSAKPVPAASDATPQPAAAGNSRVVLRANAPTRITIKGTDGKIYANREMAAGDSFPVPAVDGLYLAIGDAGAVNVELDGKNMGKVGLDNQVLGKVSMDPASLVDRYKDR